MNTKNDHPSSDQTDPPFPMIHPASSYILRKSREILFATVLFSAVSGAATTYSPTWPSVSTHRPAPEWFQDAKWGIWFHWGVFCTPMFGSEWYPRNMYNKAGNSWEYQHHMSTFGDPNGNWDYSKFLTGASDKQGNLVKFAPKLVSAGGRFDPQEWAALFDSAGAKIGGAVAQHHDGVALWDSKVNPWNTMRYGPKLDLAGLFADAFRSKGMKVMLSMHHAWNYNGYYEYVPAQSDTGLKRLFGQMGKAAHDKYWLDQLKEIVDLYKPDYIWQDFSLNNVPEANRLDFLSYYYNQEEKWGKQVVASYNDGMNTGAAVHQYERGGPGDITTPYWMSEEAISSSTWGYTQGMKYYSPAQLLHRLLDIVSKNGTLILNISPMPDGTIPQEQRTILLAIGDWLRKFGSSIYGTRAWSVYGEGPTKMGGSTLVSPVAGTAKDIRYTKTKNGSSVYAIFMGWPGNGAKVVLAGLNSSRLKIGAQTKIVLMGDKAGNDVPLPYSQDASGMTLTFPSNQPYTALAYSVRVQLTSDTSTQPNAPVASFYKNFNYDGLAASLGEGAYTKDQLIAAGVADNDISSMEVDAGLKVELFDADGFQSPLGTYTNSVADFSTISANDRVSSLRITRTTTEASARVVRSSTRISWSRGVLRVPDAADGILRLVDGLGKTKNVLLRSGSASTGRLTPGAYGVQGTDRILLGSFVVAP